MLFVGLNRLRERRGPARGLRCQQRWRLGRRRARARVTRDVCRRQEVGPLGGHVSPKCRPDVELRAVDTPDGYDHHPLDVCELDSSN